MTLNTYITNEQDTFEVRASMRAIVRKAIFNTLVYEGFEYDTEVSVTFVDNEQIKELNKSYRNKNSATDVLSFPQYDDFNDIVDPDAIVPLGDIVISLERARDQAEEYGHSFEREIAFLTVHSTLHLLGYDHEVGKAEESEMFAKQKEILGIMHLNRK